MTGRGCAPHARCGGGRIVNISSVGGKGASAPDLVPYCASKLALTGLSKGLRTELAQDNIIVTTVCPGLMRTEIRNALFKGDHVAEYAWFSIAGSLPGHRLIRPGRRIGLWRRPAGEMRTFRFRCRMISPFEDINHLKNSIVALEAGQPFLAAHRWARHVGSPR